MIKQRYIHYSLNGVLCLPLHVHVCVEMFLNMFFFYVYDIKVMAKEIGLLTRKFLENASLYLVMGQTKTKKLLLTGLETKYNVTVL